MVPNGDTRSGSDHQAMAGVEIPPRGTRATPTCWASPVVLLGGRGGGGSPERLLDSMPRGQKLALLELPAPNNAAPRPSSTKGWSTWGVAGGRWPVPGELVAIRLR